MNPAAYFGATGAPIFFLEFQLVLVPCTGVIAASDVVEAEGLVNAGSSSGTGAADQFTTNPLHACAPRAQSAER